MPDISVLNSSEKPKVLPYDPLNPEFLANPYTNYARLREQAAVHRTDAGVAVMRYKEVNQVLRDPRFGHGNGLGAQDAKVPSPEGPKDALMFMDPPNHTRLRALVNRAFTVRVVQRLRPIIEELAVELLTAAREKHGDGPLDLSAEFCRPLGVRSVNRLVGVPEEYTERCIGYGRDGGRGLDPGFTLTPEAEQQRLKVRDGVMEITLEMIQDRRAHPREDLVSDLIRVEEAGDRLNEIEILTTVANLFLAGWAAPQALLGLASVALLQHPEQRAYYTAHPEHAERSVEELVRYDSTVQLVERMALEDTEVNGVKVKAGEEAYLLFGSANRDPRAYENPDTLDLTRVGPRNVGFGHGIHYCVAAPVAKMITEVGLNVLLTRFAPELTVPQPPTNGAITQRSYAEIPVALTAGP
ncbi:cytochrome P450 [Streptomyces sp. NBC_00872]|uniref:cytochrome P450 n=1 Tax=Streptomyces sp. NBC_00872 TaxID=2903686 RepID=UPI003864D939|nr:cytochrome P450 [Streptomyces sp. NBC_00872]